MNSLKAQLEEIIANTTHDKACILPEVYDIAVQTIVQLDDAEKLSTISKLDPRRSSATAKNIKVVSCKYVNIIKKII